MNNEKIRLNIMISTPQTEEVLNFNGQEFVFGRNADVTVFINDPNFSRSHFKINYLNKKLSIVDLGSSNGTYINGTKIQANSLTFIHPEDVISVLNSTTEIKIIKFAVIENEAQETDEGGDLDLTQFSKKIFDAASLKVEQMLATAQSEAEEIILKAHEKIEKDHSDALKKSQKIIQDNQLEADRKIEAYLIENREAINKKADLEKKMKIEELNTFYQNEHENILKKASLEKATLIEEHNHKKVELEKELEDVSFVITTRKEELENIEKVFNDRAEKMAAELEAKLHDKKNAIRQLEIEFEEKKNDQLQTLEVQIENKKFELNNQVEEIEKKLASSQKDFSELYENYKVKKEEQIQTIEALTRTKEQRVAEIKNLEDDYKIKKAQGDERMNSDSAYISTLALDLEKAKKTKNEMDGVLLKQKEELASLQKTSGDLKSSLKTDEELLKARKQNLQKIDAEIQKKNSERETIQSETAQLNTDLSAVRKKLQISHQESVRLEEENKSKITILKNEFLQNKAALQEEMHKLKEAEEKRLQDLTLQELNQINKIKQDSLRIVLDLEDSITKEICMGSSKVFASTIGVDKFREVGPAFEKSVRDSLKKGVLKLLQNELSPADPSNEKSITIKKQKMWKSFGYGVASSAVVLGAVFFMYERMRYENDPIRKQLEAQALEAKRVPARKFTPTKTAKLGATFVDSVIYTEGFHELYAQENFRSDLMKKGSNYLYKKWQIDEEKSIQSYAMIFSLIDTLKARTEKIDPDFEKRDIDKMIALEKETMGKLEKILGNEVRLEAALKFQTRFYQDYLAGGGVVNAPAEVTYPGE